LLERVWRERIVVASWTRLLAAPLQKLGLWGTATAEAQTNNRGATLSFDGLSFLVSKDLAGERWSVGLNYVPVRTEDGGVVNRLQAITGSVLRDDGTATFVYCSVRDDSVGTLDDPSSMFRLSCYGGDGCTTSAEECARSGWTLIADDVSIPASFFLPPGGLAAMPQSDAEIVVVDRPSAAPTYETVDYATSEGSQGGACEVGGACLATRVGSCTQLGGHLVQDGAGRCLCRVDQIDPSCVACDGASATGQCGEDCEFSIGQATARGVCLPGTSSSSECFCHGIGSGQPLAVERCGGPLDGSCPSSRCCADDPTDGCTPDGSTACPGVCVAGSCDGSAESCGICFLTGTEPSPAPTADPTPDG
jgi:hypothetical protein